MTYSTIKVLNLSKRYRIGLKKKQSTTLVGQLTNIVKAPYENYKRLRKMSNFGDQVDESVFWALKDINFEVQQGEVLGIIGKNGAGKSTLLKILSQITEPTSGKIEIHGRVASLLEVGTGFHPELSGRDNIYMNGTILGMTKKEINHKLEEIISFSGIEKFIDTPVKYFSSGMKVRLGFSIAAHLEPEILIVDEILAVGDYEFQAKCLGKMEDISNKEGRTIIFVSHDLNAVINLCSNSLCLNKGEILTIGKSQDVVSQFLNISSKSEGLGEFKSSGEIIDKLNFKTVFINRTNIILNEILHDRNDHMEISIEGNTLENLDCIITIGIFINGVRLASLFDTDKFQIVNGEFCSVFSIDSSCFRAGTYTLGIGAQSSNGDWMWNESVTMFKIIDSKQKKLDSFAIGLINMEAFSSTIRR